MLDHCASAGIAAGVPLAAEYGNGLLVAITEQRTIEQIDRLAEVLGEGIAAGRRRQARGGDGA